jgi:Tfp pilus assembly pilus retraction ATPase PilT
VEDWSTLLRFAGTGHLTITTGHAGSLVETMAQILQAANVRTPAERSHVAGRIAALVHIRAHKPKSGTPDKVLVPAIWCRTPRTISAFTAEGLGSMLPNRAAQPGSYGRAHAVERLEYLQKIPELRRKAVEWDLRGE